MNVCYSQSQHTCQPSLRLVRAAVPQRSSRFCSWSYRRACHPVLVHPRTTIQRSSATSELASLALCFDAGCQRAADRDSLISVVIPLVVFVVIAASFLWSELRRDKQEFSDPDTGALYEAGPEMPELDRQGKLVFQAISYTGWPVPPSAPGERMRIAVGPLKDKTMRTYLFKRLLPGPSRLVSVTLPRPMGVIIEEDSGRGRAIVAGFAPKSEAERLNKVGKLSGGSAKGSVMRGDILRACTCTTLQYDTSALVGAKPATKVAVVYGADGQTWPQVSIALRRGTSEDGDVTLVLERPLLDSSMDD